MNISQVDITANLIQVFISIITAIVIVIFYSLWFVFLMYEILYLKKKLWRIKQRPSDHETEALYTKYRAEYIKNILMLLVTVLEPLNLLPIVIKNSMRALFMNSFDSIEYDYSMIPLLNHMVCWSFASIIFSATVYLLNLLTLYQINLLYSTFDTTLLKRKLRNLLIFSIILLLMTCTLFASIVSQLIALLHVTYYTVKLIKNCKYLYTLLKYRYTDSLLHHNNVPLHRAQLKIALRYKYFNIFMLTGFCVLLVTFWFGFFNTLSFIVRYTYIGSLIGVTTHQAEIIILSTGLISTALSFLVIFILSPTFVVFTLFHICERRNVSI